MISPKYIHEMDDVCSYNETCERDAIFFESQLDMLSFYDRKRSNLEMFHEDITEVTEATDGVFKTIGSKIIEIIERMKKFISDTFNKIKEDLWSKKDVDEKIKAFCKKYPDKAAEIEVPLNNEVLKMKIQDSRDLKDFYQNIDKVIEDIDRIENPDTLKNRIKAAREKFEDKGEVIITAGKIAGGVVTILKLASIIRDASSKNDKSLEDIRNMSEVQAKKYTDMANELNRHADDTVNMRRRATVITYATQQVEAVTHGNISLRTRAKYALSSAIDTGIRLVNKNSTNDEALKQAKEEIKKRKDNATNTVNDINNRIKQRK